VNRLAELQWAIETRRRKQTFWCRWMLSSVMALLVSFISLCLLFLISPVCKSMISSFSLRNAAIRLIILCLLWSLIYLTRSACLSGWLFVLVLFLLHLFTFSAPTSGQIISESSKPVFTRFSRFVDAWESFINHLAKVVFFICIWASFAQCILWWK